MGTSLEDRPRYTPTTTFETFPFPWPPGREPADEPRLRAIAVAVAELVAKPDASLDPTHLGFEPLERGEGGRRAHRRTLTASTTLGRRGSTWRTGRWTHRPRRVRLAD